MSFEIKLNGETINEVDIDPRLVTGVRLHSVTGEAGVAGTPFSGEGNNYVNLTLDIQQPSALPVVEDDARKAAEQNIKDTEVLVPNPVAVAAEAEVPLTPEGAAAEENSKPKSSKKATADT